MSNLSLAITCRTWIRDSKLLFDYRSRDYWQEKKIMNSGGCLALNSNTELEGSEASAENSIVLKICKLGDSFIIAPTNKFPLGEVISKTKRNQKLGTALDEGDIFKIGRIFFKVKELSLNCKKNESISLIVTDAQDDNTCRICFTGLETSANPLVSLCSCIGTMKYTHLSCLQNWILSKAKIVKNPYHESYKWKSLSCDVCNDKFLPSISYNGTDIEIAKINKPESSYMILEEIQGDESCYALHVIDTDKIPINIGRSRYCELKINDMSVSKIHATIELVNGKFYIRDNYSKFGTLIFLDKPIAIKKNKQRFVQVNNTFISLKVYEEWSIRDFFRFCCIKGEKVVPVNYEVVKV